MSATPHALIGLAPATSGVRSRWRPTGHLGGPGQLADAVRRTTDESDRIAGLMESLLHLAHSSRWIDPPL